MENKIKALQQDIDILQDVIETAHHFKGAYFFKPPANAGSRRRYEQYYSIPEHRIEFNGTVYTVAFDVVCSCSNVYAHGNYTRNGDKCNLTVIKNLLEKLRCEKAKCILETTKFGGADNE